MRYTYPQTYCYMVRQIESNKIYSSSNFNQEQQEEILRLFLSEVPLKRLNELNEDFIADIPVEVSLLYPDNKKLRARALEILWAKYDVEIDRIFDEAESQNFKDCGGIGEYEEWRRDYSRQRDRDLAA